MAKVLDRFLVLCYLNGFVSQLMLLAIPLWFAIILSFDAQTFSTSPSFVYLELLMPEAGWAWLSFACFAVAAVLYVRESMPAKVASNAILAFWHGFMAMCFFLGNPYGTGTGTYAILAAGSTLRLLALTNAYRKNLEVVIR